MSKGRNASKGTTTTKGTRKGTKGDTSPDTSYIVAGINPLPDETRDAYVVRANEITSRIEKLRACASRNDGKRIRRQLRALGHFGGLRHERAQQRANVVASNVVANASPNIGTQRDAC